MLQITPERKRQLEQLANRINAEYSTKEIYYLVSLLDKQQLILERKGAVAQGAYMTPPNICPYCGKPL